MTWCRPQASLATLLDPRPPLKLYSYLRLFPSYAISARTSSARALLVDVVPLLKKLEARARLQMNLVFAIAGCLRAGLGCVIGTHLFMSDDLSSGELHARPIIEPELARTLYLCELADRSATFALERVRRRWSHTLTLLPWPVARGTQHPAAETTSELTCGDAEPSLHQCSPFWSSPSRNLNLTCRCQNDTHMI